MDGEGGKFGRGGINRRLCLVYMVDGRWWTVDRLSRASNEPVARGRAFAWTENRGENKLRRSMLAVPVGKYVRPGWSGLSKIERRAEQSKAGGSR